MSKTSRDIESRIAEGMEKLAPDDAESILRLPAEKASGSEEYLTGPVRKRRSFSPVYRFIAAAACLAIILTVGYDLRFSACYAVELDANPSLTLTLNRSETVLRAEANNTDATILLEDLSLSGASCDEAVEMILDRMVDLGYLKEGQGEVMLSIRARNEKNGEDLRARLSSEADRVLGGFLDEHGVFSRLVPGDETGASYAGEYGVTRGKAGLVERLARDHPDLEAEELVRMPMGEMMELLEEKEIDLASYGTYTGNFRHFPHGGEQQDGSFEEDMPGEGYDPGMQPREELPRDMTGMPQEDKGFAAPEDDKSFSPPQDGGMGPNEGEYAQPGGDPGRSAFPQEPLRRPGEHR